MIVKTTKTKFVKTGIRTLTSATHLPIPSKPRDMSVSICPGEGVGPKIVGSVLQIFDYLRVPVNVEMIDYSSLKRGHQNQQLTKNKCLLLGPVSNKTYEDERKGVCHSQILKELDTYASVYNPISIPGVNTKGRDIDLLIVQQTDRGFQAEYDATYDDVSSAWITPHKKSDRIAQYAFSNAMMSKRTKVTALHQANVRRECHGEFLMNTRKAAKQSEGIVYEEMLLGEGAAKLAQDPESFDLIVMPNNCGDIVSSIAMSLVGGSGLVPAVHIGDKYTIFQQGGTNPSYELAKEESANPTGIILSASMMLRQANLPSFADLVEDAVFKTYLNQEVRTPDLGGNYSTDEFTKKIIENIHVKPSSRRNIREEKSALEF